jgi:hypothetical protein
MDKKYGNFWDKAVLNDYELLTKEFDSSDLQTELSEEEQHKIEDCELR